MPLQDATSVAKGMRRCSGGELKESVARLQFFFGDDPQFPLVSFFRKVSIEHTIGEFRKLDTIEFDDVSHEFIVVAWVSSFFCHVETHGFRNLNFESYLFFGSEESGGRSGNQCGRIVFGTSFEASSFFADSDTRFLSLKILLCCFCLSFFCCCYRGFLLLSCGFFGFASNEGTQTHRGQYQEWQCLLRGMEFIKLPKCVEVPRGSVLHGNASQVGEV